MRGDPCIDCNRIAANLQRSVERVLARRAPAPPVSGVPDDLEPWPDNDPEPEPEEAPVRQPASALPEAAFSLTLKGTLGGVEALLTVRGQTAAEFQANLQTIRGLLDLPAPASPQASQPQGQPQEAERRFCPKDGQEMTLNHKDGRSWYSHRLPTGTWCRGK